MKRHVVSLLSCGLLAGCAASPPPIDEPSALPTTPNTSEQPSPAAFHFKSGTLEIGDFDPYTLGDDIFDPCTEISPEEFAAAGFDNVEPFPEEYAGLLKGRSTCEFSTDPVYPGESFANTNAARPQVEQQTDLLPYQSESLPGLFTYGSDSPDTTHCYAQIDTIRGGFVSQVAGLRESQDQASTCRLAIHNMESLYTKFSGL